MKPAPAVLVLAVALAAAPNARDAEAADPAEVTLVGYVHDFDPGMAIGGETDPDGWVLSPDARNRPVTLRRIAYLETAIPEIDFARFAGVRCVVQGTLHEDALSAGGVETPYRTFDLLRVTSLEKAPAHIPVAPPRPAFALIRRLRADLVRIGIDFDLHGTPDPIGGLTSDGMIDGRRLAQVYALEVPPEGSADMYTVLAYVDKRTRRYWAVRSGGLIGRSRWVGPFRLPRPVRRAR